MGWVGQGLATAGDPGVGIQRVEAIDRELKQVAQGMDEAIRTLRERGKVLETASEQLEKEDAGFRKLKQELQEIEKRAGEIKKELDRRVASVDRFAGHYDAYQKALERIETLRVQERRLSAERMVLLEKIQPKEKTR